jgi:predicted O-methyltransferase YrrM
LNKFDIILLLLLAATLALVVHLALRLRKSIWYLHAEIRTVRKAVDASSERTLVAVRDGAQEAVNAICLGALELKFPAFLGHWSIDPFLGRWLVQHIQAERPQCVVELGSGTSTILVAKTLALLGEDAVDHVAVDHDARYLGLTRELAARNGVGERTHFIHCPLVPYEAYGQTWYEGLKQRLDGKKIDLLLVDGPPGATQSHARRPAMLELRDLLSERCVVVLDDAGRKEEREIARTWARDVPGFELTFSQEGHGQAVLSRHA